MSGLRGMRTIRNARGDLCFTRDMLGLEVKACSSAGSLSVCITVTWSRCGPALEAERE